MRLRRQPVFCEHIRSAECSPAWGGSTVPSRPDDSDAHREGKDNEHGAGLGVDGIFGRGTQGAVMAFQAANGLDVDGIVGRKTSAALGV
jgi:peptidoglycan hydrolase-like protein with peptidoglycan-binding domain